MPQGTRTTRHPILFIVLLLAFLFATPALAAPACKGLSKSQCSRNDGCTWVDGYTTKKGTKVKSYCRTSPGKGKKKGHAEKTAKKKKKEKKSASSSKRQGAAARDQRRSKKDAKKKAKGKKEKKDKKGRKKKESKKKSKNNG